MILFDTDIKDINFHIDHHAVEFPSEKQALIESFWCGKVKSNPSLFNGEQFSVRQIVSDKGKLHIYLNKTNFKSFLWMREQLHITEGVAVLATGVYVYDHNYLYLVRRKNVATNAGKIATILGSVDYNSEVSDKGFAEYLKTETFRELVEEVKLSITPKIQDMKYLGMIYEESDRIPRFRYTIKGCIEKPASDENSDVIPVSWIELKDFYFSNISNINKSDQSFIKHFFIEREIWKK